MTGLKDSFVTLVDPTESRRNFNPEGFKPNIYRLTQVKLAECPSCALFDFRITTRSLTHRYGKFLPEYVSHGTGFTMMDEPDRSWYGNTPNILLDIRGDEATNLIPKIEFAVKNYPYPNEYTIWPGPNSNTFVAWVARQVPQLSLALPTTAIGKDYLGRHIVDRAPSGTGYQLSLLGLLGVTAARTEGVEINVLGLNFGIDPFGLAIKLPGVGSIGID